MKILKGLVGNTDHTAKVLRYDENEGCFMTGLGNGGRKKIQGDKKTITHVPFDMYGCLLGSFNVLESKAHVDRDTSKAKGRVFSKIAKNKMSKLGLTTGLRVLKIGNSVLSVSSICCSSNGWMQAHNLKA